MKFSKSQQKAINIIEQITGHFGKDRLFLQEEITGAGYNTIMALVNKGYLKKQYFSNIHYYQVINKEE